MKEYSGHGAQLNMTKSMPNTTYQQVSAALFLDNVATVLTMRVELSSVVRPGGVLT
jgi:hypothetical protein